MSNIFTEQPWIADTGPLAPALSGAQISVNARRSALKMLLSVVSVFFLLMIVAYGGRMLYQDWRPTPQMNLLWGNTGVLLLSSLCLQAALLWARAPASQSTATRTRSCCCTRRCCLLLTKRNCLTNMHVAINQHTPSINHSAAPQH